MRKRKSPASGEKNTKLPAARNNQPAPSQSTSLVELAITLGSFTTLDGRNLGILNVAQRVSELRARGVPLERSGMVIQFDHNGVSHRVAQYVWRGDKAQQADFWGYRNG